MAPKKAPAPDKAKAAAKAKAAEDKTFGLKNKNKSVKVQKYVQNVTTNATQGTAKPNAAKEKKKQEEAAKELNALFAVAIKQPKVPEGVDPKSVVCEFFRHGQCTKGAKCKYSHDLAVERKGPKIDVFTDQREVGKGGEEEGMDDWDQATLEAAIKEKHSNENKPTEITCRFFLDAVEKRLYGWFWRCPNGSECKYRHALPNGYVLKSQMKELLEEEARNQKDITESIEEERAKVVAKTPVTSETFRAWHARKREAKARLRESEEEERRRKGILNGREIFMQEGFVGIDDASAADDYAREDDEEAQIKAMMAQAAAAAEAARQQREQAGDDDDAGALQENGDDDGAGPSTSSGAGPSTHLRMDDGAAELFDDDDDDDEEMEDDDDDGGDDLDDEELDELEAKVKGLHAKGGGDE